MPSLTKKPETWPFPCIQDTDSEIDQSGQDRMIVSGAEFSKFVKQVGLAVGKDAGNPSYRNVMIRTDGQGYEVIGVSVAQLAWAKGSLAQPLGDGRSGFTIIAPYEKVAAVARLLSAEHDVEIILNKTSPSTVVFSQQIDYGGKQIGRALYRVGTADDPFAKFEKKVGTLSWKSSCKINSRQFKMMAERLECDTENTRSKIALDPKTNELGVAKNGICDPDTPVSDAAGESIQTEVSSFHLRVSLENAETEQVTIKFSGQNSLIALELSPSLTAYLAPF
jgi:hypothetical protein